MALPVRALEDVASATTVAAMTVPGFEPKPKPSKDHSLFSMKKVEGQVLLSAESYTEAAPFGGDHDDDEDDGMELMYSMKHSDLSRHSKMAKDVNCFFTNNSSPSLRRNVRAWCDATGLSTTISVGCKGRVFHLHKFPLVSRSGYFKKVLRDATEVTLPSDVPGGAEIFELVSNFCYGSTILMEPANITELCCAADYFQMTEDYGKANLGERSELYLTQVALQSWDDTLVVLHHCEKLTPHVEKLGIDRRCLDSLAFMACMEALDPVARKLGDVKAPQYLHWWVQDLVALPPRLFVKLVLALRREGMKENCVGQVITAFADRWIFDFDGPTEKPGYEEKRCETMPEPGVLIKSVVKLLPLESYVVPIGFLFALLRRGLACSLSDESRVQLETRIVLQLETASLHDLLLPGKKEKENKCVFKNELESMERILKMFLSRIRAVGEIKAVDVATQIVVAKLWDQYLAEIAFDSRIIAARFADLIERVPGHLRTEHDNVYRAIHAYLKSHPTSTQAERLTVCRTLNCQKLSQEACAHAVQSELMPLRMIVQAMFMQQLQTRSVLDSHLESSTQSLRENPVDVSSHSQYSIRPDSSSSLRVNHSRDCFRSMGSSFRKNDLPVVDDGVYVASVPTPAVQQLKKEISHPSPRPEYEATESRLRSLEAELSRMRKTLVRQAAASGSARQVLDSPRNATDNLITQHDRLKTPCRMATVHEVEGNACSSGYMNQLKPGNRTSPGLLAKALQKLKFPSFRKTSTASKDHTSSARHASLEPDLGGVGRADSMPRPITTTSRVKQSRHARRNSMS